jgi:hypothetical protein
MGMSDVIRRGVDGSWSLDPSSAHNELKGTIPPEVATKIARVRFVLYHDPKDFITVLRQQGARAVEIKHLYDSVRVQLGN